MDESVRERIAIVRTKLLSRVPFMGHLCLKLEPIEEPSIPTMGVTRCRKLYYNPTFVSGLTDAELAGVLCHETLHLALLCFERQGTRLMAVNGGISLWNVAHDYAINQIIVDFNNRFLQLPKGGLQDDKYKGMSGRFTTSSESSAKVTTTVKAKAVMGKGMIKQVKAMLKMRVNQVKVNKTALTDRSLVTASTYRKMLGVTMT